MTAYRLTKPETSEPSEEFIQRIPLAMRESWCSECAHMTPITLFPERKGLESTREVFMTDEGLFVLVEALVIAALTYECMSAGFAKKTKVKRE